MKRIAVLLLIFLMTVACDLNSYVTQSNKESRDNMNEEFFFKKPEIKPEKTEIKVYKKDRILELYGDGELIGRFKVALGGAPEGNKKKEGDKRTPEGRYYICTRNGNSKFKLFLGLSYPDVKAAEVGISEGLIDKDTYNKIEAAQELKIQPPWNTPLGGEVGIHGGGTASDWTAGCIALSDEDIEIIWEYAPMKTPMEIYP
jgi:murein L,D-transpeptidase YafK